MRIERIIRNLSLPLIVGLVALVVVGITATRFVSVPAVDYPMGFSVQLSMHQSIDVDTPAVSFVPLEFNVRPEALPGDISELAQLSLPPQ